MLKQLSCLLAAAVLLAFVMPSNGQSLDYPDYPDTCVFVELHNNGGYTMGVWYEPCVYGINEYTSVTAGMYDQINPKIGSNFTFRPLASWTRVPDLYYVMPGDKWANVDITCGGTVNDYFCDSPSLGFCLRGDDDLAFRHLRDKCPNCAGHDNCAATPIYN